MPLIDVIFLLLTFFIYQTVVMRPVDTLGFELAPVVGGERSIGGRLDILSIDGDGAFYFNREPIDAAALDERLAAFAADPAEPTLYITIADEGRVDRGPVLFDLMQRGIHAGVKMTIVGRPPGTPAPAPGSSGTSGTVPAP